MVIAMLIVLGLCFGSFINALVWRFHEQEEQLKAKSKKSKVKKTAGRRLSALSSQLTAHDRRLSIMEGRSMCPNCQHKLAWYDLIPVLSWLSLKSKCRYCHKPISWQYPVVELLTAALFVLSYVFWPSTVYSLPSTSYLLAFWLIFLTGFIALAIYDIRWMILPNRIIFPMQALAGIYALVVIAGSDNWFQAAQATALSVLCSAGLFYVLFQVSKGKWIGGGDVKLAVILGLVLGSPAKALLMLFTASLLGTIISLPLLLSHRLKKNSRIPFGPLLIIGTIIAYLFGASLITWYKRQLLIA